MQNKSEIPKSVSAYFAALPRKANAKMVPGSADAKARTLKARQALRALQCSSPTASRCKLCSEFLPFSAIIGQPGLLRVAVHSAEAGQQKHFV
jgi:hypothetical protein